MSHATLPPISYYYDYQAIIATAPPGETRTGVVCRAYLTCEGNAAVDPYPEVLIPVLGVALDEDDVYFDAAGPAAFQAWVRIAAAEIVQRCDETLRPQALLAHPVALPRSRR